MTAILVDMKRYLIIALLCISVTANDVENIFTCLLSICIPPLKKCLFKFFEQFLTSLSIFLLLSCKSSFYTLDIRLTLNTHDLQIFSPVLWVVFYFLDSDL